MSLSVDTLPLGERQLDNLKALTRLLGYVRFFHPSEAVADADWQDVALKGVKAVEGAADPESLAAALRGAVATLAPTVRVQAGPATTLDAPVQREGPLAVRWVHHGVYIGGWSGYRSVRVTDEAGRHRAVLSAVFDAAPLRGRRVRVRATGAIHEARSGTATLGLEVRQRPSRYGVDARRHGGGHGAPGSAGHRGRNHRGRPLSRDRRRASGGGCVGR